MREVISRKEFHDEYRVLFESKSWKNREDHNGFLGKGSWNNCLYLTYIKEDFPEITTPEKLERDNGRFNYLESDIASLSWPGGITFYEEKMNVENGRTEVTAGCDFMHLWDDHWREKDNGEEILKMYMPQLAREFSEIIKRKNCENLSPV